MPHQDKIAHFAVGFTIAALIGGPVGLAVAALAGCWPSGGWHNGKT